MPLQPRHHADHAAHDAACIETSIHLTVDPVEAKTGAVHSSIQASASMVSKCHLGFNVLLSNSAKAAFVIVASPSVY
jgi:hypothetical protein